jgi:hypothetical protein
VKETRQIQVAVQQMCQLWLSLEEAGAAVGAAVTGSYYSCCLAAKPRPSLDASDTMYYLITSAATSKTQC